MDEIQARHRRELKELQAKITQKKKQASKKTRKGVNDECDRLENDLKAKQAAEIDALSNGGSLSSDVDDAMAGRIDELSIEDGDRDPAMTGLSPSNPSTEIHEQQQKPGSADPSSSCAQSVGDTSSGRKPNRQKARLARRAAEQEDLARQAAVEAESLPDMKQQERDRMLSYMTERSLIEKEIRADGHCLYSAVADQLSQLNIPLDNSNESLMTQPVIQYKLTRAAAADYIESHEDDFAPFLEEPLFTYVHKVRDTAEWGGQLELQALAKVYSVEINVLQDFGRVEKVEPDGKAQGTIWLGYYKHGFGLGEHYNSLRRKGI